MSWSRSYSGTADDVIAKFDDETESIESGLPEFEKGDVKHAYAAAQAAVKAAPKGAKISLSVGGHGFRDTTGAGGGAVNVGVSYSIPAS